MKDIVIFDIDGTLADCSHRLHHVKKRVHPLQPVILTDGRAGTVLGPFGEREVLVQLSTGGDLAVRSEQIQELKPDWDAFYAACSEDKPIQALCDMAAAYYQEGGEVLFVTGRPEAYREKTQRWLCDTVFRAYRHDPFPDLAELRMRRDGDFRPDFQVKAELVSDAELARTLFIVEDRQQVVDMWRKRGALVLQCAPGRF